MDARIVYVNETACRMLGYSCDELLSMTVPDIDPNYPPGKFDEFIVNIKQLNSITFESRHVTKKGDSIPVEISANYVRFGDNEYVVSFCRDITERKLTEESLRQSEERFRSYFELPLIGIAITSVDKGWIQVNDKICEILGYSKDELRRTTWDKITYPDDLQKDAELFDRLLSGEIENYTIDKRFIRKNGDIIYTTISIGCVRKRDGTIDYIVGLMQDITERMHADEALKRSEELYRTLAETAHDMIYIIGREGMVQYVNSFAARALGKRPEELIGVMRKDLFPAQVSEKQEKNIRSVLDTGMPYYAEDLTVFFDKTMWQSTWLVPLRDINGNTNSVMGISRDISVHKATEARLRESEEMFREMAENVNEVFFIFTPDWKQTVYVSPGYEHIWGRSLKSVYNDPLSWLDTVHPEDRESPLAVVESHRSGRLTNPFSVEFRVIMSDGTVKWILGRTYPIRNEKGEVYRITGIAEDITERKKAENTIAEEKALSDLYLDLMSHDINNMNQIGIGFLELAMEELSLDEKGRSLLSRSMGAMESSSRLIDNLKKLQKAKSGELHSQVIDIGRVLADVQKNYSHIPGRTVTINYTPVKGYHIIANELLYDVFSNLVGNAIKHTKESPVIGISVTTAYENNKIFYKIAVEDNGPGIPEGLKVKIFSRHLRGDTKAKGSGIGLYLVKTLVDSYQGRLWVEDRVHGDRSKGSKFVVMLPAYDN